MAYITLISANPRWTIIQPVFPLARSFRGSLYLVTGLIGEEDQVYRPTTRVAIFLDTRSVFDLGQLLVVTPVRLIDYQRVIVFVF